VPLPFAKGVFVYGEPIDVPYESDRHAMEAKRLALQRALDLVTGQAESLARGDRFDTSAGPVTRMAP